MATHASFKNFVFIPGSFHAGWCWYKMHPLLSIGENHSMVIDLPGHGHDHTLPDQITLDSYVNKVIDGLQKIERPVILIGHSRAGIVISQVAEKMPHKIAMLVYLCAYLIPDGEPMIATALTDAQSVLAANLIFNDQAGWHFPKENVIREAFYQDCTEEDVFLGRSLLTPEPNAPVATPLHLTNANYGRVKKVYIHTTLDQTITYPLQKSMVEKNPVDQTFEIKSGHSPFLSKPKELAGILLGL